MRWCTGSRPAWRYDDLGPFEFDRQQYEIALEATGEVASLSCCAGLGPPRPSHVRFLHRALVIMGGGVGQIRTARGR